MQPVDVLVIGAGQAGLSAAYHLRHRGFRPLTENAADAPSFIVLDAEERPGGAWQHRWPSLVMATVNGIYELPGYAVPPADPKARSRDVLPEYFAAYEAQMGLQVQRPVKVRSVRYAAEGEAAGGDRLIVASDTETWAARYVINATGTWTKPYWPTIPGQRSFRGRQLHVHDYASADEFVGKCVVIVGAGISAT